MAEEEAAEGKAVAEEVVAQRAVLEEAVAAVAVGAETPVIAATVPLKVVLQDPSPVMSIKPGALQELVSLILKRHNFILLQIECKQGRLL